MRVTFVLMVVALVMAGTNVSGAGPSFCYRQLNHCLGKILNLRPQTIKRAMLKRECWGQLAECLKHL
ncbi:hypothetical protein ScPMuIL_011380 [Solemya velum]